MEESSAITCIDFSQPEVVTSWQVIDDRVMGGVSRSRMRHAPAGFAVFEGRVRSDNGGGFASVRHAHCRLGSAATHAYRLHVRGDGHRYKLNFKTEPGFDGIQYQAEFQPLAGLWSEVTLECHVFAARYRGRPVVDACPLQPDQVCQVGLMIADQQWGEFTLALRDIVCVEEVRLAVP